VSVTEPNQTRSFTSHARRSQIVAATVEVIAESDFKHASFARIAERAGLSSTRLISYHFAGKADLMAAVADDVISDLSRVMSRRVGAEATAGGRLRAYIEGNIEFTADNRSRMRALLEIFLNGGFAYDSDDDEVVVSHVEEILRQGQRDGEFRDFDPRVVAAAVQRAVESLPFMLRSSPDLDCVGYARELVTLFELGTRATS
jgi:AcrR family transcriptional regulator